jgi:hypothetical protein
MATIKVARRTRDHLRDEARAARLTQGELIEVMLEVRRRDAFWATLEGESADDDYLSELAEADTAVLPDAQDSITRFEAGS